MEIKVHLQIGMKVHENKGIDNWWMKKNGLQYQKIGLGNRGHLKILNYFELVLNEHE